MRSAPPVLAFVIALAVPWRASAQCTSNASSCISCHETQALRPVLQSGQPWHVDHGFGDLCAACHAGQPEAADKAPAHVGLRAPLADASVSCKGCHEQDYAKLATSYLASSPARAPVSSRSSKASVATAKASPADKVVAALAALLAAALAFALRPTRVPLREWPRRLQEALTAKRWRPVAAGAALGVLVAGSELLLGRPIAAAGAFDKLAAYAGRRLMPSSPYYLYLMTPGIGWQLWLMVGVLLGSLASSRLAGEARLRWLPDTQWVPRFGASRVRRLSLAFAGAVLVQIGAGIAGGCTSGLAISGGSVLAPAAFLFMAGMFAGGVPTALLWYRGTSRGRP
jgi:uncharacterized membrane protein YedE/YeeE